MPSNVLRIATRQSPLALWQAEHVRDRLLLAHPGLTVELVRMVTQGDKILDSPLAKIGGKGLFVKELEQGMLDGYADIAVHSMKDVPVEFPAGLHLPVVLEREDPRDAFVSNACAGFSALPHGARVGTSSLRRQCQLRTLRPDLNILDLRGNVGTRLGKLDQGDYDAIVLAAAGLIRLGLTDRITESLPTDISLPAIGQGIVGIECRTDDPWVNGLISVLADADAQVRITAERAFNRRLGGGCQVPIAGHATLDAGTLTLRGLVGEPDGSRVIRGDITGSAAQAQQLGTQLADELLGRGAGTILERLYAG